MTIKVTENTKLLTRRNFLYRAYEHKNITKEEFDKEMLGLDDQIKVNVDKRLKIERDILAIKLEELKKEIPSDGDMKRAVAAMLRNFLAEHLPEDEIKGVFRQGYKLMRGR